MGKPFAEGFLQTFHAEGQVVLQQGHAATYTLHAGRLEFADIGMQGSGHQFGIGVEEHGAVHNVAVTEVVEGITTHLAACQTIAALEDDVVAARHAGGGSQSTEAVAHTTRVFGKEAFHRPGTGDKANHDVALVGKNGTAAALATDDVDAVLATEVKVDFLVCHLVAAHHHRGT